MHRSKLSTFVIDCQSEDVAKSAEFWSQSLGRAVRPSEEAKYRELTGHSAEPLLLIQAVAHESRIHLDIESDDIEAEVARLEALGAKRLEKIHTWVVMQAPTGQKFCVVRPQRGLLGADANAWPAEVDELTLSDEQRALLSMVGAYSGDTKVWKGPSQPPETDAARLRVEPVAGGRWVRFTELGTKRSGEMLLGYHREAKTYEMTWVDTLHTGSAQMCCSGTLQALRGTHETRGHRLGWRTEIARDSDGGLITRGYTVAPDEKETLAIESVWSRG